MTTPVFTWAPTPGVVGTTSYKTRTAQFNDGYSQAVADGINNVSDSWPLTFTKPSAVIAAIKAFLDATGGWQSFLWTPPLRAQGLFRCPVSSAITPVDGDAYTLTATFIEVFNP
ncbi:phage tail protein [Pararobbsia alpina]|uniref:phage tail protein n=1 Tax=Pararobbsia alpina TaxID=621374 RepID=UPI001582C265|nr:phage tail protein [Pararobbsia alpina]